MLVIIYVISEHYLVTTFACLMSSQTGPAMAGLARPTHTALTLYDWLKKFYNFYMAAVVGIVSRHGLRNEVHCTNQPNKIKLVFRYFHCKTC